MGRVRSGGSCNGRRSKDRLALPVRVLYSVNELARVARVDRTPAPSVAPSRAGWSPSHWGVGVFITSPGNRHQAQAPLGEHSGGGEGASVGWF